MVRHTHSKLQGSVAYRQETDSTLQEAIGYINGNRPGSHARCLEGSKDTV